MIRAFVQIHRRTVENCRLSRVFRLSRNSRISVFEAASFTFSRKSLSTTSLKMSNIALQIPELQAKHVHITNWEKVGEKIQRIIDGKFDELQIITDFDYTLTKSHVDGTRCTTCYGVIENYSRMPPKFKTETRNLFEKFYPIEIDPHMTEEEKIPHMIQWYDESHELILQCNLTKKDFSLMAEETPIHFRDGTLELMNLMEKLNVPVLVFSAGVGDVIDESLRIHELMKENVKVISNYMEFDENDHLIRFSRQLIHMFNKNESAIRNSSYFQNLAHRHNVILMGDSLGDLRMAEGVEPPSAVLSIGFLNAKIEERLPAYKEKFDIVLTDDQTMDIPRAILKLVMEAN